jgi:DNA repair protein RadC
VLALRPASDGSADEALTRRLISALGLVDVRVLDHVVVTTQESISFAALGLI